MAAGTLRIASNDPALAHGASRRGITTLRDKSVRMHARLHGLNVKQATKVIRAHYGDLLLSEIFTRESGTRARAQWNALDADPSGDDLVPVRITIQTINEYRVLTVDHFRIGITRHTLARILQRTLHHADIRAAGPMLLHHLGQATALIEGDTLRRGDQVRTASPEGVLLWEARRRDGKPILRAQTWISADGASDERLRAACAEWSTDVRRRDECKPKEAATSRA